MSRRRNWNCAAPRRTDKLTRALSLTPAGMAATDRDYQPWPRVAPKCWRCRHALAGCTCLDDRWPVAS